MGPLLSNNMSDIFPFFYGAAYTHSKEFPNVQICLIAKPTLNVPVGDCTDFLR